MKPHRHDKHAVFAYAHPKPRGIGISIFNHAIATMWYLAVPSAKLFLSPSIPSGVVSTGLATHTEHRVHRHTQISGWLCFAESHIISKTADFVDRPPSMLLRDPKKLWAALPSMLERPDYDHCVCYLCKSAPCASLLLRNPRVPN